VRVFRGELSTPVSEKASGLMWGGKQPCVYKEKKRTSVSRWTDWENWKQMSVRLTSPALPSST